MLLTVGTWVKFSRQAKKCHLDLNFQTLTDLSVTRFAADMQYKELPGIEKTSMVAFSINPQHQQSWHTKKDIVKKLCDT